MSEIVWMTVLGRRVAAVHSEACNTGDLPCIFNAVSCQVVHEGVGTPACRAFKDHKHMFITEDQLPAYLAARLTNQS